MIPVVTVQADKNPEHKSVSQGKNTRDRVFLLSIVEVEHYFPNSSTRQCKPTAFAKSQGCKPVYYSGTASYWLRTKAKEFTTYIRSSGTIDTDSSSPFLFGVQGVRPAMWINIGS